MRDSAIKIMGILNVTPDSFSDGGKYKDLQAAVAQANDLILAGADILDVGGESTRPFSEPVSVEEELQRVIPVIEAVRQKHSITISIDTSKAEVARQALNSGADIINDISALNKDPEMITVVRETNVPVIIMHMQGTPTDMQVEPVYRDVVGEIIDFFQDRIGWITENGVDRNRLIIDPGIGFGKTLTHNLALLREIEQFVATGYPVLVGTSRKRFIADLTGKVDAEDRVFGTTATVAHCVAKGVGCVRVHDVGPAADTTKIIQAINEQPITHNNQ